MRIAKIIVFYFFLSVVVIIIAFGASVFLFKDRIIRQFIQEANKSLNTPVQIGRVEVSAWRDFPNIAITFTDVYVEDSHEGLYPLVEAKTVSFYLNPVEAVHGKYSVRGLKVSDSETHLKINEQGVGNFTILKGTKKGAESITFDLRNVKLSNTKVKFQDLKNLLHHDFESEKLTASVKLIENQYQIMAIGDILVGQIGINRARLLPGKKFNVNADIVYDDMKKKVFVKKSVLVLDKSEFKVNGEYEFKQADNINLSIRGNDTDIQTVLSLFPVDVTRKWQQYQSKGEIYFSLTLKGEISSKRSPFVSVSFGCRQASIFHPDYKSRVEEANLEGSFACPSLTDLSRAELFLKNISGKLNDQPFTGDFSLQNFDDPYVSLDFKGGLEASSLLNFYPVQNVSQLTGTIDANVSFDGKISLLKERNTAQQVQAEGSVELKDISFDLNAQKIHFRHWGGTMHFNKNDIAMSNVRGQLDNSDFLLNGFLKNVITYLLFENQPIGIEADLKSNWVDLDQLVALGVGKNGSQNVGLTISPNLHLNFNCDVRGMRYKRFAPKEIKGDLLVKSQVAVSRHLTFNAMGGKLSVNGIVDAKNPKAINVSSSFKLDGIDVDSVFYVFENFYQNFIEASNLKGQANADVSLEMVLNEKLKLYSETLTADISAVIKNGELNNFEPLQKLNRYLDDEALNHLLFADLKNDIHIENRTIFIPQMEVHTNATNITLSGTHNFDQQIDYRVVAPLRGKRKMDPDEAFGAVEETGGQSKVFLKILGTTDNYEVKLDKGATKKKIVSDLKKEVKELKEAFQNRGIKKKKEVELQKDEYFDWDN